MLSNEHVYDAEKKTEAIILNGEKPDDNAHHDQEVIVRESVAVMLDSLKKHVSGTQNKSRAQKVRLANEAKKKKDMQHLEKDAKTKADERKEELNAVTPFNCPAFTAQAFNDRRCKLCKCDRTQHTLIHTKEDYEAMIIAKNQDKVRADEELGEANDVIARQNETKRRLKAQHSKLGGLKTDWENMDG